MLVHGLLVVVLAGCGRGALDRGGASTAPATGDDEATSAHADGEGTPRSNSGLPSLKDVTPRDYEGLHNVVAFGEGVYSGSLPEGESGFGSLRTMGIRTVISVDGAVPELDLARAQGLRYVHLPIGYDGIEAPRVLQIARAIRDLDGPVYIHCHHGKHRSAAAAGAATVALGLLTNEEAQQRMRVSGTSPKYTGLYACVADVSPVSPETLDTADDDFPGVHKTTGLVQGMVEIDHIIEHLKSIEKAGWQTPTDHPDLVPAAEAGRLADVFRHLLDDSSVMQESETFINWMKLNAEQASALENGLVNDATLELLSEQFRQIAATCNDCHAEYRN